MAVFPNVRSFVSVLEDGMRSVTVADLGTSDRHVHGFTSLLDNAINSNIPQSSSHEHDAGLRTYVNQGFRLFTMAELVEATNNFSPHNQIGAGSSGVVYKGKLADGRMVAIKRGRPVSKKLSAFELELAYLSRLHHKNLVRLVGFYEDKDERVLVYEYMKKGALYNHLHDKNNVEKGSSVLNSWKTRIQIALDTAKVIAYLHNYAVPPIIHRDIKSLNILVDADWGARVSDFGLSSLEYDENEQAMSLAGTIGYIDPEYRTSGVFTTKSDVYGFGVVLLELLTGKKAIFKSGETVVTVVEFAEPYIDAQELGKILDPRVVATVSKNEADAVELVAYIAMHCVKSLGKDRPTMTEVVASLERALTIFVMVSSVKRRLKQKKKTNYE